MIRNKKFAVISMPRTANTYLETWLRQLNGHLAFEIAHCRAIVEPIHQPVLSNFRDPADWYRSVYLYTTQRQRGDEWYQGLSRKRLFYANRKKHDFSVKKDHAQKQAALVSSYFNPNWPAKSCDLRSFISWANSSHALKLFGYEKLCKHFNAGLFSARFFAAVFPKKSIKEIGLELDCLERMVSSKELFLFDIGDTEFDANVLNVLRILGFSNGEISNLERSKSAPSINKNQTVSTKDPKTKLDNDAIPDFDKQLYQMLSNLKFQKTKDATVATISSK